jgi:F0F1-type ATP synthase membrane subunit c/vacuolar-type H+-ATPase subunit K
MSRDVVFLPRRSLGWLSLAAIGVGIIGLAALMLLAVPPGAEGRTAVLVTFAFTAALGLPFLVLAVWFPTMHYEFGPETLTLRYGPVLTYRIPLQEIQTIRRRNLSLSLWSSVRFPGIALFPVPYSDVGNVKMCATAAAERILLIETADAKYGLTPADEEAFVAALQARINP